MGSQIENEMVRFWGVERGVQYLKPVESLAHPSCTGLNLLWFQVLELPSHCYTEVYDKSLSLSHTMCDVEDYGFKKPTPAMTMIAYVQGKMRVARAIHL